MNPRIALVPLDERPVTAVLPGLVAAVGGATVVTPPVDLLPVVRVAGDTAGLGQWLLDVADGSGAVVVALETLGFGGLIPSRIGTESAAAVLSSWEVLRQISVPVHASCVVQRTPDSDDAMEEPDYYARHGRALHAASAALATERPVTPDVDPVVLGDFLRRRLRNHSLNLAAVGLLLDGTLDSLCVGADDTALEAIGTAEQQWISRWSGWLAQGEQLLTYPGADEMSTVLMIRALAQASGGPAPTVAVHAVAGLDRVSPYENVPVHETSRGQLRAAGATEVPAGEQADLHLVVHTPSRLPGDFAGSPPERTDGAAADASAALVARLLAAGHRVSVADCAHPNGADPALVSALQRELGGDWDRLAGFAGWNTAGNTIGTAVAHGLAVVLGQRAQTFDAAAHSRLLRHRLLEDWGWMSVARRSVRVRLGSDPTRHDRVPGDGSTETLASGLLQECLDVVSPGWQVRDVRFPWHRSFEVDFVVGPL